MKKFTTIILFGTACLVMAVYIFTLRSDLAGKDKEMAGLKRARDQAWTSRTKLEDEIKSLKQRLKNLQDMLTQAEARLANFKDTVKNLVEEPVSTEKQVDALDQWLGKVSKLRDFLKRSPEYAIPELKNLTEKDWLAVTDRSELETEADYRKALASLRARAMGTPVKQLLDAISAFRKENNGRPAQGFEDIDKYLPVDFEYANYISTPPGKTPGTDLWVIRNAVTVDGIWDVSLMIEGNGNAASGGGYSSKEVLVRNAIESYVNEYGGKPTNFDQVNKYINPDAKITSAEVAEIYKSIMTPVN